MSLLLFDMMHNRINNSKSPIITENEQANTKTQMNLPKVEEKKAIKKPDPTERLKKAIKRMNIPNDKKETVKISCEGSQDKPITLNENKMDTLIKNLIHDANDETIDKLFSIINNKLDNQNIAMKNIKNKRKFILSLI